MAVKSPVVTEIGRKTYHINEFGLASIYLIVGTERALLVDTGAGICNLKALVRRITFLPYDVVLTHGHVGHSGGIQVFREVWIAEEDREAALSITADDRRRFATRKRETLDELVWNYDTDKIVETSGKPEIQALYDHQIFNLGDREVLVLRTPGHTEGSTSFLDIRERLVITGDACERIQDVTECAVSTQMRGLFNLYRERERFDRIYGGHINYRTADRTLSAKLRVLKENIAACRCILEDHAAREERQPKHENETDSMTVGEVTVTYHTKKIWEPEENHSPVPLGL